MKPVNERGTGTVRLATASAEVKQRMEEAKATYGKAKKSYDDSVQACAEAEVNHYKMMHGESVDPHKLAESRTHLDECKAKVAEAKKAMVVAEADTYKDFEEEEEHEEEEGKGKGGEAAASEAPAAAPAAPAPAPEAPAAAPAPAPAEGGEAVASAAPAAAPAEGAPAAEAGAAPAAPAPAAPSPEGQPGDAVASLNKQVEELKAQNAELQAKLAVASAAPAAAPAAPAQPAAAPAKQEVATGRAKDAIARAHVTFDPKEGPKVILLGVKAPTGEAVATASEGKPDLSGLFQRRKSGAGA